MKDVNDIKRVQHRRIFGLPPWGVQWLCICVVLCQTLLAGPGEDHDHDHESPGGYSGPSVGVPNGSRPGAGARGRAPAVGCRVVPSTLASFANGERYDYSSMVTFLTSPGCALAGPEISQLAISTGVDFSKEGPVKLDGFAKNLSRSSTDGNKRLDLALRNSVPSMLRGQPMGTAELLPIVGQLSLLSPTAARFALGKVIEKELYLGDEMLKLSDDRGRDTAALTLAQTLVRLGASESAIASEMAESVEDMALLAQADSLAKYLRALSAAASVEASLVPTFNLTAGALNRGVQKGKKFYTTGDEDSLLESVFSALKAAIGASASLEPGAAEMNEALGAIMGGAPLTVTRLKNAWKEAVRMLAVSTTQSSLADAVSLSLTPDFIFLVGEDQATLMTAAKNYPQVAGAIQLTFLRSWQQMWVDVNRGNINAAKFNEMKRKYFEPMVSQILELDPYLIDPFWLSTVVSKNLVRDVDIEKRFPRLVLAFLDRRDRASKVATLETGLEPTVSSLAENFAVLWALSNVHVPALLKWIKKYEN